LFIFEGGFEKEKLGKSNEVTLELRVFNLVRVLLRGSLGMENICKHLE